MTLSTGEKGSSELSGYDVICNREWQTLIGLVACDERAGHEGQHRHDGPDGVHVWMERPVVKDGSDA